MTLHRSRRQRFGRIAVALLTAAGALCAIAVPTAGAATAAPTLAASFTPAEISVGQTSGITYTLTDPNSSGSFTNVSFSDTLPSFAPVDQPAGISISGCGSNAAVSAPSGGTNVSASGLTVKAGTPCVVTFGVIGSSAGSGQDAPGGFTYSGASATSSASGTYTAGASAATLTVLAPPTARILGLRDGSRIPAGATVRIRFACTAPNDANGSTLAACLASDDQGNTYTSGGRLDTATPGTHEFDVQAISTTGVSTDTAVTYTVLPDARISLAAATTLPKGTVRLTLRVPGAGRLSVTERSGHTVIGTLGVPVARAGRDLRLTVALNPVGRALLAGRPGGLPARLTVAFTPRGGARRSVTRTVSLHR